MVYGSPSGRADCCVGRLVPSFCKTPNLTKPSATQADSTTPLKSWAALVRLPNAFTIIADVTAAFCLVLGGHGFGGPHWRANASAENAEIISVLALVVLAGVSLYWGGMILNDVFDVKRDVRARRGRPLTTRAISVSTARAAAGSLLMLGVVLAVGIAVVTSAGDLGRSWTPVFISILLVACIYLYDGPLKRKPVAPLIMGACRVLSFLLGATAATAVIGSDETLEFATIALGDPVMADIRRVTLAFALGMGTYIAGITTFGRREAIGDRTIHLPLGLVLMFVGACLVAFAPRMGSVDLMNNLSWVNAWSVDPVVIFPVAVMMMVATTIFNGRKAASRPSPIAIQSTIRSALLAIIPIAAAITMLGVGAKPAIAVFALMLPSTWLAQKFRMT